MTRFAISCLLACAALVVASEARAGLRCESMGTGEAVSDVAPATPSPVAITNPPAPVVRKPATTASPKPAAPRAADERPGGGSATPDWRALIPGSLR